MRVTQLDIDRDDGTTLHVTFGPGLNVVDRAAVEAVEHPTVDAPQQRLEVPRRRPRGAARVGGQVGALLEHLPVVLPNPFPRISGDVHTNLLPPEMPPAGPRRGRERRG